ncbi:MAG: aspartate aminotransferase family protein [Bacteroidales bacterium]
MVTNRELFYRFMGLPAAKPLGIEIAEARGIYLIAPDGKKYFDMASGVAVSNIGHHHPEVLKAIKEQVERHLHLMVYGEIIQSPQVQLASELVKHLPAGLDSVYFVNSGSEAIDGAIKLAKRFTGRPEVISFKKAYHGGTIGALSILGDERMKKAFRPLMPATRILNYNDFNQLDQITGETAAVVIETVQAEAGIIPAAKGYLKAVRERCNETGTLLIIDDIQMGMGRTGKLFSFEHEGITPDILALAKAFGAGLPLGAFISSQAVMKTLTFQPELGHITTFGGHPLSCAAALAGLQVLVRESLIKDAEIKGKKFENALLGHDRIASVRRKGLMLGIDPVVSVDTSLLLARLAENGIITDRFLFRPGSFRIAPPLTITTEEIDQAIEIIFNTLEEF